MAIKMTRNEYQEFLKQNASRFYSEPGYSMEDYNRDAASVEVLGFELDKFGLSAEAQKVINDAFSSESVNRRGHMYVSGRYSGFGLVNGLVDALGCELVASGAYNGFYKNDQDRLILEYCEGDISLIMCETKEAYLEEVSAYLQFYKVEDRVFVDGAYNLYRDGVFQAKAFTEKEVKDFILQTAKEYSEDSVSVTVDMKNGYNHSSHDVSSRFLDMLKDRLPYAEDNACIEVYFDGVLVDNVYTSMDKVAGMESSLVQHGYDNYNGDVKEDWERSGGRPNPDVSFRVVEYPLKTLDAVLGDANVRSAATGHGAFDKEEPVKEQ